MKRLGLTLIGLACGMLGAVLSVAFLLMVSANNVSEGFGALAIRELPVVVFAAAIGFFFGALMVAVWATLQRFFAPAAPRP